MSAAGDSAKTKSGRAGLIGLGALAILVLLIAGLWFARATIIPPLHDLTHPAPKATRDAYVVIVADFAGDTPRGEPQWFADLTGHHPESDRIAALLDGQFARFSDAGPIRIMRWPRAASDPARAAAVLEQSRAALLIWGSVRADELDIHLLPADPSTRAPSFTIKSGAAELTAPVLASAIAANAAETNRNDQFAASVLYLSADRLRTLAFADPPTLPAAARPAALRALAQSDVALGRQNGEDGPPLEAISIYDQMLRAAAPNSIDWADAKSAQADTLVVLAAHQSGTGAFDEAIGAYRAAAEIYAAAHDLIGAAHTQTRIGAAYLQRGARDGKAESLDAAANAFKSVLTEQTRIRAPFDWLRAQIGLARASLKANPTAADAAPRQALKAASLEDSPLLWAEAQHALGDLYAARGDAPKAIAAYREALKGFTRERMPLEWASVQHDLGAALYRQGIGAGGARAQLTAAIAAFNESLKERTRDRDPRDWAIIQADLGAALAALGASESDTDILDKALAAYEAALAEIPPERAPADWARVTINAAAAQEIYGDKLKGADAIARYQEASAAAEEALDVYKQSGAPEDVAKTEIRLAQIRAKIAKPPNP